VTRACATSRPQHNSHAINESPPTNLLLQESYYLCLCIGTERTGYGPLLQQSYNNRKALSNILKDENYKPNVNALQKMKSLYKSCMNVTAIQSRGWKPLVDLIRSTGVLSMFYLTQCHRKCVSAIVQGHPTEMLSQLANSHTVAASPCSTCAQGY